MNRKKIVLLYDKQCPVCDAYCQLVRVRESVGELEIVDAREHSAAMQEVTTRGLDIDQGMVLKIGEQLYYGADAIQALALLSSRSGFFNKLNYWMFSSKKAAALIYPVLRSFRNLLLKALRKTKINNLGTPDNDQF